MAAGIWFWDAGISLELPLRTENIAAMEVGKGKTSFPGTFFAPLVNSTRFCPESFQPLHRPKPFGQKSQSNQKSPTGRRLLSASITGRPPVNPETGLLALTGPVTCHRQHESPWKLTPSWNPQGHNRPLSDARVPCLHNCPRRYSSNASETPFSPPAISAAAVRLRNASQGIDAVIASGCKAANKPAPGGVKKPALITQTAAQRVGGSGKTRHDR